MTAAGVIVGSDQLISLPDAVMRANQLLNDPNSEISDIGEVIAHDAALAFDALRKHYSERLEFGDFYVHASDGIDAEDLRMLRAVGFS